MKQVDTLMNRLSQVGYKGFEISHIIDYATKGRRLDKLSRQQLTKVCHVLERYVQLGTSYAAVYSK